MGLDVNKKIGGLICFKHFRDEDLKKSKDNKIYQLVRGAIPIVDSIDSIQEKEMSERSESSERGIESQEYEECFLNQNPENGSEASEDAQDTEDPSSALPPSPIHDAHNMIESETCEHCEQCSSKELLIKECERKIESLQSRLKIAQNSANYYKAAKSKLNEIVFQLRQESSTNLELMKELKVGCICTFLQTNYTLLHSAHLSDLFHLFSL